MSYFNSNTHITPMEIGVIFTDCTFVFVLFQLEHLIPLIIYTQYIRRCKSAVYLLRGKSLIGWEKQVGAGRGRRWDSVCVWCWCCGDSTGTSFACLWARFVDVPIWPAVSLIGFGHKHIISFKIWTIIIDIIHTICMQIRSRKAKIKTFYPQHQTWQPCYIQNIV